MEATILDFNFEQVGIIDHYKSFIWTDRYNEYGDFEIYIPIKDSLPDTIKKGYYLWNANSEHLMIIETINIDSNIEDGACYIITGRSLESILNRRIVWNKKTFSMDSNGTVPNLQNGIKTLLNDNVINPDMAIRKISNFIFKESQDEKITTLEFEDQYLGQELYEVISKLCKDNEIGFKVTLNDNNQFVFELYAGKDRSYEQDINPYVIFSKKYDNILSTNYLDSDESFKNIVLVAGESTDTNTDESENASRISEVVQIQGFYNELERRESFVDATGVSRDDGGGGKLSIERYKAVLRQKGIDNLMDNTIVTAFEGEVDSTKMYVYGEDYRIGDIVQIADEYGNEGRAYISEYVMTNDENGFSIYPTFKTIQKGVYEE